MICAICTRELGDSPRRTVATPQGRAPVHASCHQKYLDLAAGNPEPVEDEMATGTAVTQWDEVWAERAAKAAAGERVGGDFLSTRGGVLSFQEEALPGNQMVVVILDAVIERTFYAEKFDATSEFSSAPICYAFGRHDDEEELAPHPSMQKDLSYFQPQNDICKTCPNNEWGSADTGRGKACNERRRMALLPAGYYQPIRGSRDFELNIFSDAEHYAKADIAYLKIPVTSVKDWARYVTQLSSQYRRPPAAMITRVYIEPDAKSQFRVKFEMIEELPSELFETIMKRVEEAEASIIFGYPAPSGETETTTPRNRSARR